MSVDLTLAEIDTLYKAYLGTLTLLDARENPLLEKLQAERTRLQDVEDYKAKRAAEQAEREANKRYALTQAKPGDVIEYQAIPRGLSWSPKTITRRAVIREVHVSKNKYGSAVVDMTVTVLTKAGEPHKTLNTWGGTDEAGVFQRNYATRVWNLDPATIKLILAV